MWKALNKTQRLGIDANESARDETGFPLNDIEASNFFNWF